MRPAPSSGGAPPSLQPYRERVSLMVSRIVRPHRIAEIPGTLEGDARTWEMAAPWVTVTWGGNRVARGTIGDDYIFVGMESPADQTQGRMIAGRQPGGDLVQAGYGTDTVTYWNRWLKYVDLAPGAAYPGGRGATHPARRGGAGRTGRPGTGRLYLPPAHERPATASEPCCSRT